MVLDYFNSRKYKDSMERIKKAFNYEIDNFQDVPLILQTNSYWLTGHSSKEIPEDYYDNPRSMLEFQEKGIEEHLKKVDDDYIPYLMPWYGVSLIPGVFGSKVVFPKKMDPSCTDFGIKNIENIREIEKPDFINNPLTKKVLETIKYFKKNGNYPVSVTDMQSTLDCIALIVGYKLLFYWMHDYPEEVDFLFKTVNEALIEWVKIQKKYIGERNNTSNGLINLKPPDGVGIWWSDDDAIILSPDLYERFVAPYYSKLFGSFGRGMIHWCGNANHQLDNILGVKKIKAVHNYFLGDIEAAVTLQNRLKEKKICLAAGDIIPVEEELDDYLKEIKEKLNPRGLVLQFTISPKLGLRKGQYTETKRDVINSAHRILNFFRG
ncbi:MAG: uroporphyrinogen decarboxylase family protein [Actinomycetota bacterium]